MTEQTWGQFREPPPKRQFGRTHAFYANMGGFAFYGSYDEGSTIAEEFRFERVTNPRHTVDVPKFETLIYIMTYFPDIITDTPEETILDRAQSSSLGKFILVVQVTWFCINCLSRLDQHLPLTLIEVSTAAHAFCTILTYIVWWSKPMNVAVPTILEGEEAEEVYALLKCSDSDSESALAMAMAGTEGSGDRKDGKELWRRQKSSWQQKLCDVSKPHSDHHPNPVLEAQMMFPGTFQMRSMTRRRRWLGMGGQEARGDRKELRLRRKKLGCRKKSPWQ